MGAYRIFLIIVAFSLSSFGANASQTLDQPGDLIVETFPAKVYGGARQVWDLAHDAEGQLYVATHTGISVFDGARWRFVALPKGGAFSLAQSSVGDRLYFGGMGNLGYLALSSTALPEPHSLLELLPEEQRDVGTIWQVLLHEGAVYFRSLHAIYRYQSERIERIDSQANLGRMFLLDGKIWTQRQGLGLYALDVNGFSAAPLAQAHDPKLFYFFIGDWAGQRIGVSMYAGIFEQQNGRFVARPQLEKPPQVYGATVTLDGALACGTTNDGLYLIEPSGRVSRHLDMKSGLPSATIISIEPDRDGALWLGTQDGLARVSLHQPLTLLGQTHGLGASTEDLCRRDNTIYVASNQGLHRAHLSSHPIRFESLGLVDAAWCLLPLADGLLVGGSRGVYLYRPKGLSGPFGVSVSAMLARPKQPAAFWVGNQKGLFPMTLTADGLAFGAPLLQTGDIRKLCEDGAGTLWVGSVFEGLYVIRDAGSDHPSVTHHLPQDFGTESFVLPFQDGERILLSTDTGLFRVTRTDPLAYEPISISGVEGPIKTVNLQDIDEAGRLHFISSNQVLRASPQADGHYTVEASPFARLGDFGAVRLVRDPFDLIWALGAEGLACFDDRRSWQPKAATVLIRATGLGEAYGIDPRRVPYAHRNPHFEAALPQFDATDHHSYRFRLDPFDTAWSAWSAVYHKDYTNLPPGSYQLSAQARDAHGLLAAPATYAFRILPPWYRTLWAYAGYGLFFMALLFGLDRLRAQHHHHRAQALEHQVRNRTLEVEHQKVQLAEQNQKLEQQNQRILTQADELAESAQRQRDLFANLSHEFRTPLTLTLGPLEDLLAEDAEPLPARVRDQLARMRHQAHQLLELINQLLDLARLDAKALTLRLRPVELVSFARQHVLLFESHAVNRRVDLSFASPLTELWVVCDATHLEKILNNLLANAIAATPPKGRVDLDLSADETGAILTVKDSGRGMDAQTLAHVFDRFFQGEARTGGSGIGLALARELVTLHQGRITVQSQPGDGTIFTIWLPLDDLDGHLAATEAAASIASHPPVDPEPAPLASAEDTSEDPPCEVTVLIVEDHPEVRSYLLEALGDEWRLVTAERGDEGLERALELLPDLVISDVMMPGMDGFTLCQALKNDRRTDHIPVILLTARADLDSRLTGLEQGADDYLAKPFNRRELVLRVRNQLQSRRNLHSRYAQLGHAPLPKLPPSADEQFVARVDAVIAEHLSEVKFGVAELADQVHLSARQLQRKLNAITGQGPLTRLRDARLARAKQLLTARAGNVAEIAYQVGYETPEYFSKQFRKTYGMPPSEFMG